MSETPAEASAPASALGSPLAAPPAPIASAPIASEPNPPTLSNTGARRSAALLSLLALVFAGLIAPLAYAANLAFAPFTAVAGLLCLPLIGQPRAPSKGLWLLIGLLAWALVTYAWSPAAPLPTDFEQLKTLQRVTGLKLVFELALYASFALAMRGLPPLAARRAVLVAAILLTVVTAVLLIEALIGPRLYSAIKAALGQPARPDFAARNIARACYVLALLLWPLLVVLVDLGRRAWAAGLTVGVLLAAVLFKVDAPILALAVGAGVFAAVWAFRSRALAVCVAGVAIYFVLTPVLVSLAAGSGLMQDTPGHVGKASWGARMQIWSFVDQLVLARPLTGWGLDSSRSWPTLIPLHPHNAALQLWLELGPIGAGLAALFFAWVFSRIAEIGRTDRVMAAAAAASTTAYLTIGALSFGVWQEWWLALGAVTAAVCAWAASSRHAPREGAARRGELVPL